MDEDSVLGLDVVVPVFNEESTLEASVRELHRMLCSSVSVPWLITIADNASTDLTPKIAEALADELADVRLLRLEKKGRGHALKIAWLLSEAEVLAYVDADLSTDLRALPPLIAPLLSGHSDVAIGTRLAQTSRVVRGTQRELVSRGYNMLLRRTMGVTFSDAQCGFKAMRRGVARVILPHVYDTGWFFDTEMLVIAERAGLRIHEVPVDWIDDEHDQQVHWFIGSGTGSIGAWVRANFAARTVAGVTLYDLTTPSLPASASVRGPTLTSADPAP